MSKQVKIVFDGKVYWLLWHWETLSRQTSLSHSAHFVDGWFATLHEARAAAANAAKDHGWTVLDFSGTQS